MNESAPRSASKRPSRGIEGGGDDGGGGSEGAGGGDAVAAAASLVTRAISSSSEAVVAAASSSASPAVDPAEATAGATACAPKIPVAMIGLISTARLDDPAAARGDGSNGAASSEGKGTSAPSSLWRGAVWKAAD